MPIGRRTFPYLSTHHRPEIPPSYLVFTDPKDGLIKAKNGVTGVIDYSGTDAATVIQSVVNALGEGKIFIKNGIYVINSKITCPSGIFFDSEGAELDLTGLDDVAFEFGDSGAAASYYEYSGFKNIVFRGNSSNTNSVVALFYRIPHGVILSNVKINGGYRGIILDGECFDAQLENLFIYNVVNDQITVRQGSGDSPPNGFKLLDSDIGYGCLSRVIVIEDNPYDCVVSNTYIEAPSATCIEVEGYITVEGCVLSGSTGIIQNGGKICVIGNEFRNGLAFNCTVDYAWAIISGNRFSYWYVASLPDYLIYSVNSLHGIITGNVFQIKTSLNPGINAIYARLVFGKIADNIFVGEADNGTFVYLYGYTGGTSVTGNTFYRGDIGIKSHSTSVNKVVVANNIFEDLNTGVDFTFTGGSNIVAENIFESVDTPISADFTKVLVKHNKGYTTENSGTATIPNGASSVVVAHGLAGIPNVVVLGPTHSEVVDAVWAANSTHIIITVPSAVTADRDISWSAEYKP